MVDRQGVQVICCGDQGQPPPIADEMPHEWICGHVEYYEEVLIDYRAKDDSLKALKRAIRNKPDNTQCEEMRKAQLSGMG